MFFTQIYKTLQKIQFIFLSFFFPFIFACSFTSLLLFMKFGGLFDKGSFIMMSTTEIVTFIKN